MIELLHVMLKTIYVLIPRIFFKVLLNMLFSKFSSQKLNILQLEYVTDLQMQPIFERFFQTIFSKQTTKLITFIFSETLISTYFKTENLLSKKISHMNLQIPSLLKVNKYKGFCQTFSLAEIIFKKV